MGESEKDKKEKTKDKYNTKWDTRELEKSDEPKGKKK